MILPMSTPIIIVATILQVTGIWNDFILGLMFAGRDNLPMTVLLNNIVNSTTGRGGLQRRYGRDDPHRVGSACSSISFPAVGSCAASPPAR